jgi:hypothetical protein
MRDATRFVFTGMAMLLIGVAPVASRAAIMPVLSEHVTGGNLDLVWVPGFNTPVRNMQALTLDASDPAYANPSGDHTVGVAVNTVPDSGGIILTCTDPGTFNADYTWEGDMFTGGGNTRRGLVLRADPTNSFESCYQFVVQAGLLQINFRKLIGQNPTTLGTWFSSNLPPFNGGTIPQNTWIHLKVIASGSSFRCFINGYELTGGTPITDTSGPLLTGWVGAYNFRFDTGLVPVYFDDLVLSADAVTPAQASTWGSVKARYR